MLRRSALPLPLIRLPAPSPRRRGEGICRAALCHLTRDTGTRLDGVAGFAASVLLPVKTGRRWRQPDEGQAPTFAIHDANSGLR
jgi:hypothetical protein